MAAMAFERAVRPYIIDTVAKLQDVLIDLGGCAGQLPRLFISVEGHRHRGSQKLSLITIMVEPARTFFLIDVTSLGEEVFTTATAGGTTLKSILESPNIIKVIFDICDASEALFCLYDIHLDGMQDVQLMELAARTYSRKYTLDWQACIERSTEISEADLDQWQTVDMAWQIDVSFSHDESCDALDRRPMSSTLVEHCVHSVLYMPFFRNSFREKLSDAWWERVEEETQRRIQFSQQPDYRDRRTVRGLGPTSWSLRNRRRYSAR